MYLFLGVPNKLKIIKSHYYHEKYFELGTILVLRFCSYNTLNAKVDL